MLPFILHIIPALFIRRPMLIQIPVHYVIIGITSISLTEDGTITINNILIDLIKVAGVKRFALTSEPLEQ